ncbi:ATP-dependent RNA helicase HrpA [Corynebacterium anserum]|uniref:ATP-dependent RNA helicase HrpA n=1 Tax=Corynebacterium anserum TaxID=2684406 RepID=UPI0028BF29D4|nr:ATP-dependent RNA helicase HrpA [Corynebacterium anserum]
MSSPDQDNHHPARPTSRTRKPRHQRRSGKKHLPRVVRHFGSMAFPEHLPVSERRADIMKAIQDNQVVIIAGETGSGKTTQIPKMCVELGRGRNQMIGHTQPRRIAARSVAERIAEEMGHSIGDADSPVGYKIRFDDTVSRSTAIKLMTDGVLLNEIQRDRYLRAYDTIIVDEAHERSLNIDFLLGYIKQLLPKRPDLKVIITSATINPEAFAEHFSDDAGNPAPIIEVSGRTYPVEIRYRPLVKEQLNEETGEVTRTETDPLDGLVAACAELMAHGPGDILCFFSGEREIRDAADALSSVVSSAGHEPIDILPLYGRLSNAEQHRVFSPGGRRRIVLATNIAETSLTVPGIHYVVDTGYARISRYSHRTKVQRLPVEEISQASATQRSGRCGRTANGIAIRLYSEANFLTRPEFTDPEILRTHLASVILSMAALGLGDIEQFPFLQEPDNKSIRDGIMLLQELGALTVPASGKSEKKKMGTQKGGFTYHNAQLTQIGRDIAQIPTDPRLARMLEAAHRNDVLEHVAVIVAALSIQDVRERPLEQQARADQLHARFNADSDFISLLTLWNYLQTQRRELSGNQFRKLCHNEYIHYMRAREWMDLVRQLLNVIQDLHWHIPNISHVRELTFQEDSYSEDAIHKSILTGLLTHVGMREGNTKQFTGTRNSHFLVHPGSHLAKKPPQWIMAAELVETSQVFARTVGPIDPAWIEDIAPHMVKYVHSEPHWSSKRGAAMVHEKVLMLGLPLIADRRVNLGRIDRQLARELFIRHALVEGDWTTRHHFFSRNHTLLEQASQLEDKARRRDIIVDDETLFSFYDNRLPASIVSARHFDSWWKKARHKTPDLLDFDPDHLIDSAEGAAAADAFPDVWHQGSLQFDLTYVFQPGDANDGITMRVPLPLLANVDPQHTQWLVAGLRHDLCVALIKSLPKPLRRTVVPATDFARTALERMVPFDGPIDEALAGALRCLGGTGIQADDFDWSRVPDHLRMNVAAIDRRGKVVDKDRDLEALQSRLAGQITRAIAQASARSFSSSELSQPNPHDAANHSSMKKHTGKTSRPRTGGATTGGVLARSEQWDVDGIGVVPETVETIVDGQSVEAFPAVVSEDGGVVLRAFPTLQAATAQQFKTVHGLMMAAVNPSPAQMVKGLPLRQRVALENYPHGGLNALVQDITAAVCSDRLRAVGAVIRDPQRCNEVVDSARREGASWVRRGVVEIAPAVLAVTDMSEELKGWTGDVIDEMNEQLDSYLGNHAVARHGVAQLKHVPRYVRAMKARLELMDSDPDREENLDALVHSALQDYQATIDRLPRNRVASPQLKEVRWMIEELRVSLFAQNLGTARSVSVPRIRKALAKIH